MTKHVFISATAKRKLVIPILIPPLYSSPRLNPTMATIRSIRPMVMHMGMGIAGPSRLRLAPALFAAPRTSLGSRAFATASFPTSTYPSGTALPAAHVSSSSNSNSNSSGSDPNPNSEPDPQPKSAYARFKLLTKKYGWYALGMYTALSSIDFTLSFLMVHALGVERIEPIFSSLMYQYRSIRYGKDAAVKIGAEHRAAKDEEKRREKKEMLENGGKKIKGYWGSRTFWAEAVLAYGIHKTLLLPLRAGLTVAWTPKVVNWFTRNGWIGKVSGRFLIPTGCFFRRGWCW